MRRVVGGLLALVAALVLAQPAAANGGGSERTLERYAEGTWRSFAAMTDEQSGPAERTSCESDGTRSVQTSTTNIGAYMWSAVVAERLGIIRRSELVDRGCAARSTTLEDMERLRAERAVLQLVRPPDGREADGLAAVGRAADPDPVVGRQRLAGRRPEGRRRAASPSCRAGPASSTTRWTSASTTGRTSTGCCSTSSRARAARPCCYDTIVSESRIAAYIGIAKGRCPNASTSAQYRSFPDSCDWSVDRDATGRLHAHATSAPRSTTARCPTTARSSRRAGAAACSRR